MPDKDIVVRHHPAVVRSSGGRTGGRGRGKAVTWADNRGMEIAGGQCDCTLWDLTGLRHEPEGGSGEGRERVDGRRGRRRREMEEGEGGERHG